MKNEKIKKLYAYVDESGQDTKGLVFVVSVLILENEYGVVCEKLERIEFESGKKNQKWNKSKSDFRQAYIEGILKIEELRGGLFFEIFSDSKKYIKLTSYTTAKAILKKSGKHDYKVTVFVDGFKKKEVEIFTRGLRELRIKTKKIRGVKKDENNALIRLVDSVCGLIRDSEDGNEWAVKIIRKMIKAKLVTIL